MVRQLPREQQVGLHGAQHRGPAAGADAHRADQDVFHLPVLRDRDGETFGVADAARDALDQVRQGLRRVEGYEAAHAGVGES